MKLSNLKVAEIMSTNVPTVAAGASIEEVLDKMIEADTSFVVVVEGDRPVGMVTERTLLPRIGEEETARRPSLLATLFQSVSDSLEHAEDARKARATTAAQAMSRPLISIDAGASVASAVQVFSEHNFRQLTVVDDGRLIGVLRQRDVVGALRQELKSMRADAPGSA